MNDFFKKNLEQSFVDLFLFKNDFKFDFLKTINFFKRKKKLLPIYLEHHKNYKIDVFDVLKKDLSLCENEKEKIKKIKSWNSFFLSDVFSIEEFVKKYGSKSFENLFSYFNDEGIKNLFFSNEEEINSAYQIIQSMIKLNRCFNGFNNSKIKTIIVEEEKDLPLFFLSRLIFEWESISHLLSKEDVNFFEDRFVELIKFYSVINLYTDSMREINGEFNDRFEKIICNIAPRITDFDYRSYIFLEKDNGEKIDVFLGNKFLLKRKKAFFNFVEKNKNNNNKEKTNSFVLEVLNYFFEKLDEKNFEKYRKEDNIGEMNEINLTFMNFKRFLIDLYSLRDEVKDCIDEENFKKIKQTIINLNKGNNTPGLDEKLINQMEALVLYNNNIKNNEGTLIDESKKLKPVRF